MRKTCLLVGMLVMAACSRPTVTGAKLEREGDSSVAHAETTRADGGVRPELPAGATSCTGAHGPACVRFASDEDAFRWVLAHEPAIVGVGEAHAQKGTEAVASATKRFTDSFLPLLSGRASDLLVEAWGPNASCPREVSAVASAHKPVRAAQADTNSSEYLALGHRAKALGIVPDLLHPSCEDYTHLAGAGADAISASLALIKRLTEAQASLLYQRNQREALGKVVVTYGGAMHNDLAPTEALRAFSFGPELNAVTGGQYVELDLIVPEYVKGTAVWEKLPWYASWRDGRGPKDKPMLFRVGERSFTLVFAETPRTARNDGGS